jgi:photosystem II stability/assembly factor-like uncharacterized protein
VSRARFVACAVALTAVVALLLLGGASAQSQGRPASVRSAAAWTPQPVPTLAGRSPVLYAVAAVSPQQAWAAGSRSVANVSLASEVVRTTDGQSWALQWSPGSCCTIVGLAAPSPTVLWAVRDSVCSGSDILKSNDGGDNWTRQASTLDPKLWAIAAPSTEVAWAVGYDGTVYTTADGGATWTKRRSATVQPLWAVTAASTSAGWAVGSNGAIVKTVDGGVTWSAQPSGVTQHLLGVSAASTSVAWAVGTEGTILKTVDGGATWERQASGQTVDFEAVAAVSPSVAWAAAGVEGGPTHIVKTVDGGATWVLQYQAPSSGSSRRIAAIAAVSPSVAWVASTGTILGTNDGGVVGLPPPPTGGSPTATPTLPAVSPTSTPAAVATVVGPSGGKLATGETQGTVCLKVPAGAVSSDTTFEIKPRPIPTVTPGQRAITAFSLDANGGTVTQFNTDLVVSLRYDPAALGSVDPSTLTIYRTSGGIRERLPTTVDLSNNLVQTTTNHFSDFEVSGVDLPTPTPRPFPPQNRVYNPVAGRAFADP